MIGVLDELARRAHRDADSADDGYTPMISVVGDVGQLLASGDHRDLRNVLPHLAAVREGLEYSGNVVNSPYQALLEGPKASAYLAGALWASSGIVNAFLEREEADEGRSSERADRTSVQRSLLAMLRSRVAVRPADVVEHLSRPGPAPSPALVSKTISDLIGDGVVVPAPAPSGADRRHRYYQLAQPDSTIPAHVVMRLRSCLADVYSYVPDRGEAQKLVEVALDDAERSVS